MFRDGIKLNRDIHVENKEKAKEKGRNVQRWNKTEQGYPRRKKSLICIRLKNDTDPDPASLKYPPQVYEFICMMMLRMMLMMMMMMIMMMMMMMMTTMMMMMSQFFFSALHWTCLLMQIIFNSRSQFSMYIHMYITLAIVFYIAL